MMLLGINEDQFDAGVALCHNGKVLFASNEERYTRRKNEGGFPHQALAALLEQTKVDPRAIDGICVSGFMTPPLPVRLFPRIHYWLYNSRREDPESWFRKAMDLVTFATPITHTSDDSLLRKLTRPLLVPIMRRTLPGPLKDRPVTFVEHHSVHTAGAWKLSGFEDTLCITADGMGDAHSMTVSRCSVDKGIERLWYATSRNSIGMFFEMLTEALGFVSHRDEGKLTGLAAMGDPARVKVPSPFSIVNGEIRYSGVYGLKGIRWARENLISQYSREDVSAWAQQLLEDNILSITRRWVRETGLRRVTVAGGIFANVKLNQHIHELDEVEQLFVYPNMGDAGLALGTVCAQDGLPLEPVTDVFWGDAYGDEALEAALRRAGLVYERMPDPELQTAELLAEGRVVARYRGEMEWGPRALGNRSILVRTTDRAVVDDLNTALDRSDFMPFAPAILDEDAEKYLIGVDKARHAAEFMTVCFRCTERMQREHPAVVHVDGTARAQLVRKDRNPSFHRILDEFKKRSGSGVLLNTSFNLHEEPIIRQPEEAINAFLKAGLDYLALGPFLVRGKHLG